MFRFKKSIPVEYDVQGYIYFASRRYADMPQRERKRIEELCELAGGQYQHALFEFVTTDTGAAAVCAKHFISESTLERIVRNYYIAYAKRL